MQTKKVSEHELVKICMTALCKKAGFADPGNLVQRDLKFLCEQIESKTGVLISLSTVKRLLNGQFSRIPQIATLDAIAITLGYQNWQTFKLIQSQKEQANQPEDNLARLTIPVTTDRNKFKGGRFVILGSILFLAIVVLLAITKFRNPGIGNADKAQFSAIKVTGNSVPNTVIFKYNVDSVAADSFFIQQSWDRNRRVKVHKGSYTLTDIYYEPGFHTAKLIANNRIIKRLYVSIPTDRWFFYSKESVPKSKPVYIHADSGIKDGALQLTKIELLNSMVDIKKNNEFYQVYFPSKIANSSDNFVLKFRVKVNELNNEQCPFFVGEIFCQQHFMYFESTLKGCTSEISIDFGDNFLNGKTNDLSALGSNITQWQNVEFAVKNKNVSISINGVKAFSTIYNKSCGLITGIGFISNALCAIDFVDLKTGDGKNIYVNDFEH